MQEAELVASQNSVGNVSSQSAENTTYDYFNEGGSCQDSEAKLQEESVPELPYLIPGAADPSAPPKISPTMSDIEGSFNNHHIDLEALSLEYIELSEYMQKLILKKCFAEFPEVLDFFQTQLISVQTYPKYVIISGRMGFNNAINGTYELLDELHQNRPAYQKTRDTGYIRWHDEDKKWLIDLKALKHDHRNNARISQDVPHPGFITKNWVVYDGKTATEDKNVKMDIYYEAPKPPDVFTVCISENSETRADGDYYICEEEHEGRPLYKKPNTETYIRWFGRGQKWYIDFDGLKFDDDGDYYVKEDAFNPSLLTQPWVPLEKGECPPYIIIKGRKGYNYNINGIYELQAVRHEGRASYKKSNTNCYIRYFPPNGQWLVDLKGLKQDSKNNARVDQDVWHPGLITKPLCVFDGTQTREDPNVKLEPVYEKPKAPGSISLWYNDHEANGNYTKIGERYGRPLYRKGNSSCYIRWYPIGIKWCIDVEGLSDDDDAALSVQEDVFDPSLLTKKWLILEKPPASNYIRISGRKGYNDVINGYYIKLPECHQGRPVYKKIDKEHYMRWYPPKSQWMIDCKGLKNDALNNARVTEDVWHPLLITQRWFVYNGQRSERDPNLVFEELETLDEQKLTKNSSTGKNRREDRV